MIEIDINNEKEILEIIKLIVYKRYKDFKYINLKNLKEVLYFLKYEVRYKQEKREIFKTPLTLWKERKGDCEDKAIFLLSFFLFENILKKKNWKTGIALIRWENKNIYHAVPFVYTKLRFILIDTTYKNLNINNIYTDKRFTIITETIT